MLFRKSNDQQQKINFSGSQTFDLPVLSIILAIPTHQGTVHKVRQHFFGDFWHPPPHVSNRQHFNNPSLKSTSAFAKFSPPPKKLYAATIHEWPFFLISPLNGFASRKFVSTNITKVNVNKRQFSAKWHWCSSVRCCNQDFFRGRGGGSGQKIRKNW